MPETPAPGSQQVIALAMLISAIVLFAVAYLMYSGTMGLPEETRAIAGVAVGVAAFGDLLVGLWFFSKSRSL